MKTGKLWILKRVRGKQQFRKAKLRGVKDISFPNESREDRFIPRSRALPWGMIPVILILLTALFWTSCASSPEESPDVEVSIEEAKAAAGTARESAVEVKAPKAAADEFNSAQSLFEQAAKAEAQGDYSEAAALYDRSAEGFLASADTAVKAREAAEAAMADTDQAIADSEAAADKALLSAGGDQ